MEGRKYILCSNMINTEGKFMKYTWDDLYKRAEGKACGETELKAKDNARGNLTDLIKNRTGQNIDEYEIPEDAIEDYLKYCPDIILFDENGNIEIWKQADDYQWRKKLNETTFHFVEIRDGIAYEIVSGIVDVEDYSEDEREDIIKYYYSSMEEFTSGYTCDEINGILAECIFEEISSSELSRYGNYDTEEDAEKEVAAYLSRL